ncbi:MAG TPA: hypothetical protein IAD18_00545 [Candidatus Limisoma intestinavium]|uniref:Uncharacterized protein n=1 Tax=Candidatus Limisoma intestinavium TaxID=2840856 RepID=A0A9D1LFZ3_9BACT|nr:hypothetical protein [Candidatus Limisoma intestinavium]
MQETDKKFNLAKILRLIFGVIMIIVYVGMGALLLYGFFDIPQYVRIILGILFIVYGIYRAYRQYKGLDYTTR